MTLKEFYELHDKYNSIWGDDFTCDQDYGIPGCTRRDLNAFFFLDKLLPETGCMICSAEHDQIWLDVNLESLAEVITEDGIRFLVLNHVNVDSSTDSLFMFV